MVEPLFRYTFLMDRGKEKLQPGHVDARNFSEALALVTAEFGLPVEALIGIECLGTAGVVVD